MTSCESAADSHLARNQRYLREEMKQWLKGIAISTVVLALFMLAAARSVSGRKEVNELCLKQIANEEHTTLEAFFQNPADQDAMVQAITACLQ